MISAGVMVCRFNADSRPSIMAPAFSVGMITEMLLTDKVQPHASLCSLSSLSNQMVFALQERTRPLQANINRDGTNPA